MWSWTPSLGVPAQDWSRWLPEIPGILSLSFIVYFFFIFYYIFLMQDDFMHLMISHQRCNLSKYRIKLHTPVTTQVYIYACAGYLICPNINTAFILFSDTAVLSLHQWDEQYYYWFKWDKYCVRSYNEYHFIHTGLKEEN